MAAVDPFAAFTGPSPFQRLLQAASEASGIGRKATEGEEPNKYITTGSPVKQTTTTPQGNTDRIGKNSIVYDGDYVTLHSKSWGGVFLNHSIGAKSVQGSKRNGALGQGRFDNSWSFMIRKVRFVDDLKAFVVDPVSSDKKQRGISKKDYVVFIASGSPNLCMGTKKPSPGGNNGDYQVRLYEFPLITQNELTNSKPSERAARFLSFGFWNNERSAIDFMSQALCVWEFYNESLDNNPGVNYGIYGTNIRNLWTKLKPAEASIWDHGSPLALIIQSTFNGGRNLTFAAGKDGKVVKLALTNKNKDDKAMWTVHPWNGDAYPASRVLRYTQPEPGDNLVVPSIVESLERPAVQESLSSTITVGNQDKRSWANKLLKRLTGYYWAEFSYLEQLAIMAVLITSVPLALLLAVEVVK